MKIRILAALVLVPVLVLVLLVAPSYVAAAVVGLLCGIASYELLYGTGLVKHARLNVYSAVMAFCVSAWSYFGASYHWAVLGILLYMLILFGELMAGKLQLKVESVALCLLSGILMPFFFTALVRILQQPNGKWLIVIPFLMAFLSDTGAYFVGIFFGKHKMAPRISPKKSWEGFAGGIAGAMAMGALGSFVVGGSLGMWLGLSAVVAITSVFGDLVESMFKREAGIKDSGKIMPGHGGVLDRFDALLISSPFAFVYLIGAHVLLENM